MKGLLARISLVMLCALISFLALDWNANDDCCSWKNGVSLILVKDAGRYVKCNTKESWVDTPSGSTGPKARTPIDQLKLSARFFHFNGSKRYFTGSDFLFTSTFTFFLLFRVSAGWQSERVELNRPGEREESGERVVGNVTAVYEIFHARTECGTPCVRHGRVWSSTKSGRPREAAFYFFHGDVRLFGKCEWVERCGETRLDPQKYLLNNVEPATDVTQDCQATTVQTQRLANRKRQTEAKPKFKVQHQHHWTRKRTPGGFLKDSKLGSLHGPEQSDFITVGCTAKRWKGREREKRRDTGIRLDVIHDRYLNPKVSLPISISNFPFSPPHPADYPPSSNSEGQRRRGCRPCRLENASQLENAKFTSVVDGSLGTAAFPSQGSSPAAFYVTGHYSSSPRSPSTVTWRGRTPPTPGVGDKRVRLRCHDGNARARHCRKGDDGRTNRGNRSFRRLHAGPGPGADERRVMPDTLTANWHRKPFAEADESLCDLKDYISGRFCYDGAFPWKDTSEALKPSAVWM
ncbi:hypothetical protein WN48_09696 [Eufriesea mexicana]|uniref:Uncharacterized protein n=1 Tax=Eufriesea mexicana TaxID=516756 RepID=A0A310SGN0_9HYME|nr:hypothetical protein WN48_09696 [Eufriesea mexicana]